MNEWIVMIFSGKFEDGTSNESLKFGTIRSLGGGLRTPRALSEHGCPHIGARGGTCTPWNPGKIFYI